MLTEGKKVPGYEAHHINSVAGYPEMAGDPANIEFLTRTDHFAKHGNNWQNQTTGELIDRTVGGKIVGIGVAAIGGLATVLDSAAWAMDKLDYVDPIGIFTKIVAPTDVGVGSDEIPMNYSFSGTGFGQNSAGGGFVLYPNKPNTNMMQQVYSK